MRCEIDACKQRSSKSFAGIRICWRHAARFERRGTEWCAHAEREWAWANGHGTPRSE